MNLSTTPVRDLFQDRTDSNYKDDPSSLPESAPSFQSDELPKDSEFSEKDMSFPEFTPDQAAELTVDETSYELDSVKPKVKAKTKQGSKARKPSKKKK
jgi:hypothetical protein